MDAMITSPPQLGIPRMKLMMQGVRGQTSCQNYEKKKIHKYATYNRKMYSKDAATKYTYTAVLPDTSD